MFLGGVFMLKFYKHRFTISVMGTLMILVFLVSCAKDTKKETLSSLDGTVKVLEEEHQEVYFDENQHKNKNGEVEGEKEATTVFMELTPEQIAQIKPDESGKIMIVMFHNFVEAFEPTRYDNGEYTTTFTEFEKLIETLYKKDYRLISMEDYLNHNIEIPAGKIPMIFTFDDATAGQFHLIKKDGKQIANPKTAVGILEKFNQTHPDFGTKGVFYVNLDNRTFPGEGSLKERLTYLVDKGFEIGNHTRTHMNLRNAQSAQAIMAEVGGNQKVMESILPGYAMKTFSLTFGVRPDASMMPYVIRGQWEDVFYEHAAVLEVGWQPTLSPIHKGLDLMRLNRVRAEGIKSVEADLAWWLSNLSLTEQYRSDGNPQVVTVPSSRLDVIDPSKIGNKKLVSYE
jgi:hypothetical protein